MEKVKLPFRVGRSHDDCSPEYSPPLTRIQSDPGYTFVVSVNYQKHASERAIASKAATLFLHRTVLEEFRRHHASIAANCTRYIITDIYILLSKVETHVRAIPLVYDLQFNLISGLALHTGSHTPRRNFNSSSNYRERPAPLRTEFRKIITSASTARDRDFCRGAAPVDD